MPRWLSARRPLQAERAGPDSFDLRGTLPSGWIDYDFEIACSGQVLRVPRLLVDSAGGAREPVPLPFPREGRMRGIVRLPEKVKALRLELSATGELRL
ncbi:MAG: hypothetical protein ACM3PC_05560, partial [Deltaproteobacteria bacterium]